MRTVYPNRLLRLLYMAAPAFPHPHAFNRHRSFATEIYFVAIATPREILMCVAQNRPYSIKRTVSLERSQRPTLVFLQVHVLINFVSTTCNVGRLFVPTKPWGGTPNLLFLADVNINITSRLARNTLCFTRKLGLD